MNLITIEPLAKRLHMGSTRIDDPCIICPHHKFNMLVVVMLYNTLNLKVFIAEVGLTEFVKECLTQ